MGPISIIVVVQVVLNAGDTGETVIGENVHVLVIQAVPKHIVARVACVSRGRRLENTVLLKGLISITVVVSRDTSAPQLMLATIGGNVQRLYLRLKILGRDLVK